MIIINESCERMLASMAQSVLGNVHVKTVQKLHCQSELPTLFGLNGAKLCLKHGDMSSPLNFNDVYK